MDTTTVATRSFGRLPLAALGKVTIAALIGFALTMIGAQALVIKQLQPTMAMFSVIMLIVVGVVAIGWRWAPLLGAFFCSLPIVLNFDFVFYGLTHPEDRWFAFNTVSVAVCVVGIGAGIGATVQNYRRPVAERRGPRWLAAALAALAGTVTGALVVALLAQPGSAGVHPEILAELPALTTREFVFDQREIHARVGETIALRLDNADAAQHSFDIDEFNVHVPMPGGASSLALLVATKPGTYTFYCGVPGHADKATRRGMIGTLVVTQ